MKQKKTHLRRTLLQETRQKSGDKVSDHKKYLAVELTGSIAGDNRIALRRTRASHTRNILIRNNIDDVLPSIQSRLNFDNHCFRPFHHYSFYFIVMSDSDSPKTNGKAPTVAKPPGAQIRRRANNTQVSRPNSSRAAGAGGSSNTMLKLYTDDSPGLRVDPFIVLMLSIAFIASIFFLHISAKVIRLFTK
ncbi:Sec61beta family-domain-containing protein [Armillaria mellea]|nr:Sec61beta family-domain-containing protein [Armillaria mellea]